MADHKLFMILLGCRTKERNTEQHDMFFGIAKELRDLVPEMKAFWKGAVNLHVDAWRVVEFVDGYKISISESKDSFQISAGNLFFLNLGGYKENVFEEFHYKMLTVANNKAEAAKNAKQSPFYLHTGFSEAAAPHIDDRFGLDVDDLLEIKEILSPACKKRYAIVIDKISDEIVIPDKIHLGFFLLRDL